MSTIATHADCTVWKVEFDLKFDILLHFSYAWSIHSCRCWSCAASEDRQVRGRTSKPYPSLSPLTIIHHPSPLTITHHPSPLTSHYSTSLATLTFHHSLAPFILYFSPTSFTPHFTHHLSLSLIPSPITSHLSLLSPHLALSHIIHPIHSPSTILIVQEHKALLTILVAVILTLNVPV